MKSIYKIYTALITICGITAGILLVGLILIIVANIFGRATGLYNIIWATTVSEYDMQFVTMLAAPLILRKKGHIFMEAVPGMLPTSARIILEKFVYLFCLVLSWGITYFAASGGIKTYLSHGLDLRALDIPGWILYATIVFGFGLMGVEFALYLFGNESMYNSESEVQQSGL